VITNDTHTSLLDSTQELRVIRSHRAPRRKLPRRLVLTVAAVLAAGTLMPLGASAVVPPTSVAAVSAVQAAPVAMAEAQQSAVLCWHARPLRLRALNESIR
jgi:hypothetical protein